MTPRRSLLALVLLALLVAEPVWAAWKCRSYDLGLGGIEDMAFDPESGAAILSAYDRRAVEEAIDEGAESVPAGGLYRQALAPLARGEPPDPERLSLLHETEHALRPHGIDLFHDERGSTVFVVQRRIAREGGHWVLRPEIQVLALSPAGLERRRAAIEDGRLCSANDVAALGHEGFLVTGDRGECSGLARLLETWFGLPWGQVRAFDGKGLSTLADDVAFPNGILLSPGDAQGRYLVASTRDEGIELRPLAGGPALATYDLAMAPDNLTLGSDGRVYVAGYPSLLEYALFRAGLSGRSRTRVASLDPASGDLRLELEDPGDLISAASVALRHGDLLLLGAAFDSRLAVCREAP